MLMWSSADVVLICERLSTMPCWPGRERWLIERSASRSCSFHTANQRVQRAIYLRLACRLIVTVQK